jgi:hypothetical protein
MSGAIITYHNALSEEHYCCILYISCEYAYPNETYKISNMLLPSVCEVSLITPDTLHSPLLYYGDIFIVLSAYRYLRYDESTSHLRNLITPVWCPFDSHPHRLGHRPRFFQ